MSNELRNDESWWVMMSNDMLQIASCMASDQICSKHRLQHFRITHIGMDSSNGRSASAPALDTIWLLLCSLLSSFLSGVPNALFSWQTCLASDQTCSKHRPQHFRNTHMCSSQCLLNSHLMLYSTFSFSSEINRKQEQNNSYSNCSIAKAKY